MLDVHAEMGEQLKADQQLNMDSFSRRSETCNVQIASVECARMRLEEQIMAKKMASELAVAAKERKKCEPLRRGQKRAPMT